MTEQLRSSTEIAPKTLESIEQTRDAAELIGLGRTMFPHLFESLNGQGTLDASSLKVSSMEGQFVKEKRYQITGCDAGACMVSSGVGGDFYKCFAPPSPNGNAENAPVGLVIGDAIDHDLLAGYLARYTRIAFKALWEPNIDPGSLMQSVNHTIVDGIGQPDLYVTALYGNYHPNSGEFTFARAGHVFPFVYDAQGEMVNIPYEKGTSLNMSSEFHLHTGSVIVPPGGTLLLLTDGVLEARGKKYPLSVGSLSEQDLEQEEALGIEGFNQIARSQIHQPQSMHAKCRSMMNSVFTYQGIMPWENTPPQDDCTIVGLKRL